jgi:hypothetical protein
MANDTDILLQLSADEWAQARQSEDQRATMMNILLLITSAIIGLISQRGLVLEALPLTILLILLGIYGAVISEKLYETFWFHVTRASFYRGRLDKLKSTAQILKLNQLADTKHTSEFPRMQKIRLHSLWLMLHLSIALAGLVLTLIIVFPYIIH